MKLDLYQGDCLAVMKQIPDRSVDLILTDPPYEISRDTNFAYGEAKGKDTDRFRVSMNFGEWDKASETICDVFCECYRILRNGGTMICFYDLWKISNLRKQYEDAGFRQIRFIEWIKTNPVPLNSKVNYLTNSREIAVVGVKKSNPTFHSEYDNGIYHYPICHGKNRFHPTQKPVGLMRELIEKHSDNGDTILDCFMGSGTTGVACIETNRNFIGIEIDKNYFNMAEQRLKNTYERCGDKEKAQWVRNF